MKFLIHRTINDGRRYMIVSTKHTTDGFLQFWGEYTDNPCNRSFSGYMDKPEEAERYSINDLSNGCKTRFLFLTSNDEIDDFDFRREHFIISVDMLPRIARVRYVRIDHDGTVFYRLQIKPELFNLKRNKRIQEKQKSELKFQEETK